MGAFGYFPTYALGNLYAAQFSQALQNDLPNFEGLVEAGNFLPILEWLRMNIHRHGSAKLPTELLSDIAGEPLAPGAFLEYLQAKYRDVYRLS
jgi:carboxypeptidase Taq